MERVMGIEPTRPAWKAGILAIELHPQATFEIISWINMSVNSFLKKIYLFVFLCFGRDFGLKRSFLRESVELCWNL